MKHAYLIMAHNDFAQLNQLLYALDDERNDIYLHIDRKTHFSVDKLYKPLKAEMILTPRIRVNWGGDSQIRCELLLLEIATSTIHKYYHLISGADLPIKTHDAIHAFFENNTKNYIIHYNENIDQFSSSRLREYHIFQNIIGRNGGIHIAACEYLERLSLWVQKKSKINRLRQCSLELYKGGNWFSITHEMALQILSSKQIINKIFGKTLCADEFFVQTIAMNSVLKDTVVSDNLRYIDWARGSPYTFRSEDEENLMNSDKLFARKFNSEVDAEIIRKIIQRVKKQ